MRAWAIAVIALCMPLSGCAGEGGVFEGISNAFSAADPDLGGLCGHTYRSSWDKQIFIDITLDKRAALEGDVKDLEVSATYLEDEPIKIYDERSPDEDGCVSFRLKGEGAYNFWAFGEAENPRCFLQGYSDGAYNGEAEIVVAHITVTRQCS